MVGIPLFIFKIRCVLKNRWGKRNSVMRGTTYMSFSCTRYALSNPKSAAESPASASLTETLCELKADKKQ